MKPSVAASEYAGAVEATPMTTLDRKPIALRFSPLSGTAIEAGAAPSGVGPAATLSVAISVLVPLLPRIGRGVVTKVTSPGGPRARGAIPKNGSSSYTSRTSAPTVVDQRYP